MAGIVERNCRLMNPLAVTNAFAEFVGMLEEL
jgi:hypothetical protein